MRESDGSEAAMVTVTGALLARMVDGRRGGVADLDARAALQYHLATSRLPWARDHHRLVGLVDGAGRLLATAERAVLAGSLDGAPVRLCAVGEVTEHTDVPARFGAQLVQRLVEEARRRGDDLALIAGEAPLVSAIDPQPLPAVDVTVTVTESTRRGAPMAPVRSGDRGDLAVIAAMPPLERASCRLRLDRPADYLDFRLTRARLRAGLGQTGARQLHFLVVEEGTRAAAYAVISATAGAWSIEACGDHDPTGARVGAILQAMIALEPAERRPTITGGLPPGFLPPQLTIVSVLPATPRLWLRALRDGDDTPVLTADDVALWRWDRP